MFSIYSQWCLIKTQMLWWWFYWSFVEKTSVKQSIKQQVCSNYQMMCTDQIYPPAWNCQWQQIKYWLVYVLSESPFKMVTRIRSSFQTRCTLRWADPPIWNCHWQQIMYWLIYVCSESPFETVIFITALHCVIWCWAIGEVSHTFITYENEAIYVNFKLLLFLLCLWFHVVVVYT